MGQHNRQVSVRCSDAQVMSIPVQRWSQSPVLRQASCVDGSAVVVPFSTQVMVEWCSGVVDGDASLAELLAVAEVRLSCAHVL